MVEQSRAPPRGRHTRGGYTPPEVAEGPAGRRIGRPLRAGRIALDLLTRSMADGLRMKWLTADEAYGRVGEFRRDSAKQGLLYVVEVPCSTTGWTAAMTERGGDARRVDALWRRGGPSPDTPGRSGWEKYHVKNTEKGPVVWEARAVRFHPHEDGGAGDEQWLIVARNVLTDEVKYFLSNAPEATPRETMLRVAFTRWAVEHLFHPARRRRTNVGR